MDAPELFTAPAGFVHQQFNPNSDAAPLPTTHPTAQLTGSAEHTDSVSAQFILPATHVDR